jgi:hypothetical protein
MKIHLTAFLSNLILFSLGTLKNASQLNTLICESEGLLPNYTSCGVKSTSANEGKIFIKYFTVLTTYAHNYCAIPTPLSMLLALSINVLFIFLEIPFLCGVYGVVFFHAMPYFLQNYSKFFP